MIPVVKTIIEKLYEDTSITVTKANTTDPVPNLPYAVYNTTSPYIKDVGMHNETYEDNGEELTVTREESYKSTLSMNLYAESDEEAIELASKVRNWFTFQGEQTIQDLGIAITMVGNIENRTTFLVDSYEYKHGFDVQLRLPNIQTKVLDHFDTVETGGVTI